MRADWQVVPNGDISPGAAGIYVSMNPKGDIMLSRATYKMLDEPPAFLILFDKVNNRIGLQPAAISTRNAYPVRGRGACGGKMVRGHRMTREYRLKLAQTVEFCDADIDEDGILVLDLRTAKISPRAANHYRNRAKGQNREQ